MSKIIQNEDGEFVSTETTPTVSTGNIIDGAVTDGKIGSDAVTNEKIINQAINQDKLSYTVIPVTVAPMGTSGESIADPTIENGVIIGCYPIGNQDQFVTNVEITEDFKAKVTLGSAATTPNIFNVVILKK
jgi:hypothetical protein